MIGILLGIATVLWLLYMYWTSVYHTWSRRGIPSTPGKFPYGSSADYSYFRVFPASILEEGYKKFSDSPYFGMYVMRTPLLVIRDPEIVCLILSKEFSHFRDRQGFKLPKDDYLIQNLFNLEGERWRALRVKMSPTFTSGKLKGMFPLFVECAMALDNLLLSHVGKTVDVKDLSACFTTDIICSCAFGLEVNSLKDSENEFRKLGKSLTGISKSLALISCLLRSFPSVTNLFSFRFTPRNVEHFLMSVIKDTVEHREKTGMKRNDFLDLLIQLKNKGGLSEEVQEDKDNNVKPLELTMELLAAQCFVFFVAGFETSSSVQSYCFFELAQNPEIQEKLRKEIDDTIKKYGGVTYQAVQEMTYLDMVISETMRKYPTLWSLKRNCTKAITTPAGHRIEKGDRIVIPVWSLHHDPSFFPNPEKFDPERFSPENKTSIQPYSYLPFGEGPRICIGMRFGLLQTKLGIITMLNKYKIEPSEKTTPPLEFVASFEISAVKGPIFLKLRQRP